MAKKKAKPQSPALPDVTEPTVLKQQDVGDNFDYKVAFNIAFIGVGQAGGRITETFWQMGYGRVGVINTALVDLQKLDDAIPKLDLGTGGAGKDMEQGRAALNGREEEIYEHLTRCVGTTPDFILVCAGLGGGTGGGIASVVVDVARSYMSSLDRPNRVGLVLTLPTPDEGPRVCRNAVTAYRELSEKQCSPVVIIDNKRIGQLYRKGVSEFYPVCNQRVASLFHFFNQFAAQRSTVSNAAFDPADYATLLDGGLITFAASPVQEYKSPADISEAIRKQLADVLLAEVDMRTGAAAGCIFLGGHKIMSEVPMDFFGGGFSMLGRMLHPGAPVHRGIYEGNADDLRCYTMISGLAPPAARLRRLADEGHFPSDPLAGFLGVDNGAT
jgi:cell division protein FtsZ